MRTIAAASGLAAAALLAAGCGTGGISKGKADTAHGKQLFQEKCGSCHTLADAGTEPDEIDYVNAHGTSTPENDKMECLSLAAIFGYRLPHVPISSNKSMVGHTLIAAGSVEAVFTVLTLQTGVIPPTINYDDPDPALAIDVVPNVARTADVRVALSNSFGFGGQNVCVVFSRDLQ